MLMARFRDRGEDFLICSRCNRVGRLSWAHACGSNWYGSLAKLREADRRVDDLIGTTVTAQAIAR